MNIDFGYVFGILALITSLIGLLPQTYKAYISKSTKDVSMLMLINYMLCSIFWIVHGSMTDAPMVVYSNILGLITSIISIAQKFYYDSPSYVLSSR